MRIRQIPSDVNPTEKRFARTLDEAFPQFREQGNTRKRLQNTWSKRLVTWIKRIKGAI